MQHSGEKTVRCRSCRGKFQVFLPGNPGGFWAKYFCFANDFMHGFYGEIFVTIKKPFNLPFVFFAQNGTGDIDQPAARFDQTAGLR